MATAMRVTGAWVQLLTDWLDRENLPAPTLRAVLDSRSPADLVPLPLWRDLLQQAVALRPERLAPGLEIGALIQPRHVGMLGYLILTCRTLGEAMLAYQRYETLFYGQAMLSALPGSDSFDRALQHAMVRLMPEAAVTLPRLGAELHMSVRTLQRRLTQRQLTRRELLDQLLPHISQALDMADRFESQAVSQNLLDRTLEMLSLIHI